MSKPAVVALLLAGSLCGCSDGAAGQQSERRAGGSTGLPPAPSRQVVPADQATGPANGSAARTPACTDPAGDSRGAVDLTSVTVDPIEDGVLVNYDYTGQLPQAGAVLFSVTAGGKQYGYEQVDGRESSHFIFDLASGEQEDVSGGTATVRATDSTFQYRVAGGLDSLFGGDAVVNINGDDVDGCEI